MNAVVLLSGSRSCPALRYRDVGFAASWLCMAFGFERHATTLDDEGRINYAELSFGHTIIMLGAIGGFEVDNLMKQPDEVGGAETQCSYLIVGDLDAHYGRARDAGAKIVLEIKTHRNGTRGYTCADPEGHLWNFGTYDPYRRANDVKGTAGAATSPDPSDGSPGSRPESPPASKSSPNSLRRVIAGLSVSAIALILACASAAPWPRVREAVAAPTALESAGQINARPIEVARRLLAFERTARRTAERRSASMRDEVARERTLRVAAEQATHKLDQELSNARRAKDLAVSAMISARQEVSRAAAEKALITHEMEMALADERTAREDAQRFATKLKAQLSEVQLASTAIAQVAQETNFVTQSARRSAAEALEEARRQVITEQAARAAAELATKEARDKLAQERSSNVAAKRRIQQLKKRLAMVTANGGVLSLGPAF